LVVVVVVLLFSPKSHGTCDELKSNANAVQAKKSKKQRIFNARRVQGLTSRGNFPPSARGPVHHPERFSL
jgi:hypothetical protein